MNRRVRLALYAGVVFVVGLAIGWAGAPRDQADVVDVTVREGAPQLEAGTDAVVTVRNGIIEEGLLRALQEAQLPIEMEEISVDAVAEGYRIEARARVDVRGFDVTGTVRTVAHPNARGDGTIEVQLTGSRVAGVSLPGIVEETLQDIVNREVSRASQLEGYRVVRIETSAEQLFVYLAVDREELFTSTR